MIAKRQAYLVPMEKDQVHTPEDWDRMWWLLGRIDHKIPAFVGVFERTMKLWPQPGNPEHATEMRLLHGSYRQATSHVGLLKERYGEMRFYPICAGDYWRWLKDPTKYPRTVHSRPAFDILNGRTP